MPLPTLLICVLAFAQAPAETRSASVTGRVVDAVTGRPVAGAIVTPAGPAVTSGPAVPPPSRALTNTDGVFVIRGLRSGTVFFSAEKTGYGTATYNQRRFGGSGQGIQITDGKTIDGIEIRMWRYASISGTVVDEAGDPAVGVRVQAFTQMLVAGRPHFAQSVTAVTDDRGVYRLGNLGPGAYAVGVPSTQTTVPTEVMDVFFGAGGGSAEVRARTARELNELGAAIVPAGTQYAFRAGDQTFTLPPGSAVPHSEGPGIVVYPTVFFPAAPSLAQAGFVSIRAGEERSSVDLQLIPSRTTRVSGTVIAPDGPASTVGVRLVPASPDGAVELIDAAMTVTNNTGTFTFPAVPPGQYELVVLRKPREPIALDQGPPVKVTASGEVTMGTAVRPTAPAPPPIPSDATLYARLSVPVGDTPVTDLVVPLLLAPRVTGHLDFEGTADKPPPAAFTGIRINLDPADGSQLQDASIAARAGRPDEDGQFRTFGVPPGRYVLRVTTPGGWVLKGAFAGGVDITDTPFTLGTRDLNDVVITFTDRPAKLSGIVRNGSNGDPDAVVVLFPPDSATWIGRGAYPRRLRNARADKNGSYTIAGIPAGEYLIAAIHEDSVPDWQNPAFMEKLARVARSVRVLEGDQQSQDLSAAIIR
jgi:hypothetical protein